MSARTDDWLPRHRLTVDEYYRMGETGVLAPDARVELINGEIIDMAPPGSRHAAAVTYLTMALTAVAGEATLVSVQQPLRLNRFNEPQPDLMLLHKRSDYYAAAHPGPADIILAIEVSESSLRYDRQIKLPLYANHGIQEFWLIDLNAKELHVCRQPQNGTYSDVTVFNATNLSRVTTATGTSVDLSRLFHLSE
jgi:Uma2 family endonuclease